MGESVHITANICVVEKSGIYKTGTSRKSALKERYKKFNLNWRCSVQIWAKLNFLGYMQSALNRAYYCVIVLDQLRILLQEQKWFGGRGRPRHVFILLMSETAINMLQKSCNWSKRCFHKVLTKVGWILIYATFDLFFPSTSNFLTILLLCQIKYK